MEGLSGFKFIAVPRKRQPPEHQIQTALVLPDMGHLMDEKRLCRQTIVGKTRTPHIAAGMAPDMPIRRHGDMARLKPEPRAAAHGNRSRIEHRAKNAAT